ncbi:hypothetical protein AK830_g6046 [Neonectria ditissima]|uniref:Uncharacterized protein n=1 Tax=Neonectria ditissima TaxID=78410 RepID=A0A0P7BKD8_9HYPO|nr:hypothetical protein AK830_g6046 [Neonectria ditissima]
MAQDNTEESNPRASTPENRTDTPADPKAPDANSDNASSNDHVHDKDAAVGVSKWEKLKTHLVRFRWYYLIGLIILLAILLPIMFKVIIPVIIQNVLNGQHLPIYGGTLQALSPTNVNMTLHTSLDTPLGVKLDPTVLNLYNKNTTDFSPFLKLNLPELHIHHKTDVTVTNQTLLVTNETELLSWFNEFFDKPAVKLSVKASTNVHLGSLKYKPSLDKTIEIPSLNYLDGFGVRDMEFLLKTNDTKYNMKGHLNIPNSGALALGLGNLTFNLVSGETNLGIVHLYNVLLKPGNNSVPFDGDFYFQELVPNLATVLDSQKAALGQGRIEFNATGNSTIVDGKHIKYIEGVLNKKRIKFQIPVITLLSDVVGGVLGSDQASLLDILGSAVGNSTLFEHLLDHWETTGQAGNSTSTRSVVKRSKAGRSWMWKLIRLGIRSKMK